MWVEDSVLKRFCLVDSSDYGQIKDVVSQHLRPHRMRLEQSRSLHSQLYGVCFGDCALLDLRYGAAVEIEIGDIQDYYLLRFTLQGAGQVFQGKDVAVLRKGTITVSSPSQHSTIQADEKCRNLLLRVERSALESQLQIMLGRALTKPLIFQMCVDPQQQGLDIVRSTIEHIHALHQHPMDDTMRLGVSAYAVSVLLTQLPHNYSALINLDRRSLTPRHVRLAQDYIESHLNEALTLVKIAEQCGVSVRTLQNGFARFLDQTPTEYLRSRRLARIHHALKNANGQTSVTDILLEHGVSSIGHFATHYRKEFGCLPSVTLKQHC